MAKFSDVHGSAKKSGYPYLKYSVGLNTFRLFGEILPRYQYWVNGRGFECLRFNRDTETFDNTAEDPVNEAFPEANCKWAYLSLALDKEGKIVIVPLKKSYFEEILNTAEDLGDPTDPENGWDIVVRKTEDRKSVV